MLKGSNRRAAVAGHPSPVDSHVTARDLGFAHIRQKAWDAPRRNAHSALAPRSGSSWPFTVSRTSAASSSSWPSSSHQQTGHNARAPGVSSVLNPQHGQRKRLSTTSPLDIDEYPVHAEFTSPSHQNSRKRPFQQPCAPVDLHSKDEAIPMATAGVNRGARHGSSQSS